MDTKDPADKYAPWSSSKVSTAKQCPLQFYWRYVNKQDRQRIENPAGRIGQAVHAMLEDLIDDPSRSMKKVFKDAVMGADLTKPEMRKTKAFKSDIEAFLEKFRGWKKHAVEVDEVEVEKEAAITRDLNPCGYWSSSCFFRGVWDVGVVVDDNGDKKIVIFDHKTGNKKSIDNYEDQLRSYIVSAYGHYPGIVGVQPALHWVKAADEDSIEWYNYYSRDQIENELIPWFHNYIENAANSVEESIRGNTDPETNEGWYCQFCSFQYQCPAKN